jgi:hypothetical protein
MNKKKKKKKKNHNPWTISINIKVQHDSYQNLIVPLPHF